MEPAQGPMSAAPEATGARGGGRLVSLDALRGFDMFWITGGGGLVAAWGASQDHTVVRWVQGQTQHVEWHGFTLWDLIFPLFLFLAGVSMPLSFAKRRERGATREDLLRHALVRGFSLVGLGLVYNGLLRFDWETLRWGSVLGRIGLGWMGAALCVLYLSRRGQWMVFAGVLLGYWAALSWIPVPGFGAGNLAPGATLTDWIDRQLLPGRLYREVRDPEGLLGTLPAVCTALAGVFAGRFLTSTPDTGRRLGGLALAGAAALALGWLWHQVFPINKNLWSSSFVLWTAGLSLWLLGLFHLWVDVWGFRRLAFPFVVIGMNPILIYMLQGFVPFDELGALILGGAERRVHPVIFAGSGLLLRWLVLYGCYRRGWFLRV